MRFTSIPRGAIRVVPTLGIAVVVFISGTFISTRSHGSDHAPDGTVLSESADRAKSATAGDWLARADHVVVATAVSEQPRQPSSSELDRGEGLIMRDLRFRVDDVLWSTERAGPPPAPSEFEWLALGWLFKGSGNTTKIEMSGAHEPRFELGHTYIMALEWELSSCGGNSEEAVPGSWRGLGSGALLPYDDGRIGDGEFEGTDGAIEVAKQEWAEHGATLAAGLAGTPSTELESVLEAESEEDEAPGGDGVTC